MSEELINNFLSLQNYDVRKTQDARWIDQKCTYDVLYIIADCILEYTNESVDKEFTVKNIWDSEYARKNVKLIFSKPDPKNQSKNEYNKYFGQPIKLFSYSNILSYQKNKKRYIYKINNLDLLKYIALRQTNALNFLVEYIKKVLIQSDLWSWFKLFFESQNKESFSKLKEIFTEFTFEYTKIKNKRECGRIFTKILNPIAFSFQKRGTKLGRISGAKIMLSDLQYNRENWRDILDGKEKGIPRNEYCRTKQYEILFAQYQIQKAKNLLKRFNEKYNNGNSEINNPGEKGKATQMHHIFPKSDFPEIADYSENLIAITPNEHFLCAHPNNNTNCIDRDFQYICLLAKAKTIMNHLKSNIKVKIYSLDNFKTMLDIGLKTNKFQSVKNLDFFTLIKMIDNYYSDSSNKNYKDLIKLNYPELSN